MSREQRQEGQKKRRPGHAEHVPEVSAGGHEDVLQRVGEGFTAFFHAFCEDAEIFFKEHDLCGLLGHVDGAVDRYAYVGGVDNYDVGPDGRFLFMKTLEGSRKAVLDVEASELRRIERDLHDGAQQRLVMLTIDLGLAAERLDTDPASARTLVLEAQDQARLALSELRDLVRGIAPAILLDRGLVPALSALAARAPVPTAVQSTLPIGVRPSDAVERAAYFAVAESLANVAKHASASRCEIRCRPEDRALVIEVWDDGIGGASVPPGGGLAGLAGRVEALDGTLSVESPEGGPTLVRATLPVTSVRPETAQPGNVEPDVVAPPVPATASAGDPPEAPAQEPR